MNLDSQSESPEQLGGIEAMSIDIPQSFDSEQPTCADTQAAVAVQLPFDEQNKHSVFVPIEPENLREAGLADTDVESLILKYLNNFGTKQGREIAQHIKLPFGIVHEILNGLKHQSFVSYKSVAAANDYVYELSEPGQKRSRNLSEICSYCGAAPVGFDKYVESVSAQTLRNHQLTPKEVTAAFDDLLLPKEMLAQLGQAVNSGRCIFFFGESGNGKTSVATRCIDAYDSGIWIPRTLTIGGEIIRLFDPSIHEELPHKKKNSILKKSVVDERWVRIKRPKIVAGGELNFAQLELSQNRFTGVLEAPIHMKSNSGCLVIDDFGRQRVESFEMLNRWIIPLENGMDYIRLPNGRKIESPFDQMLIFSTNLEANSLGEAAFFRRVPYKVQMKNPSKEQFATLFNMEAERIGFSQPEGSAEYLIQSLQQNERSLKYSYVNDILEQCVEFCEYHNQERTISHGMIDLAIHNFFASY